METKTFWKKAVTDPFNDLNKKQSYRDMSNMKYPKNKGKDDVDGLCCSMVGK